MQAFAGNCLFLTVEAFWLLSLSQYIQRVQLHEREVQRRERHAEILAAQNTAMVANTGFVRFEKPREAKDFMPSEWAREAQCRPKRLTRKQQNARDAFFMRQLVAYQNANVERGIT